MSCCSIRTADLFLKGCHVMNNNFLYLQQNFAICTCNSWIIFSHFPRGGSSFLSLCCTSNCRFNYDCCFLDHFPSSHHGHDQAVIKKVNNLDLGGEVEFGKSMGPESIFKTRLCVSFVAGGSCAFGGRCALAHAKVELHSPAASQEVEDQVVLMVFMMIVRLLFCRNA